mmetsp:Transcript_125488/g.366559  ORF Transcript_125488/g.366559 Transcript_125488/m.366559 type:complete len:340 (-) Transcript_125488:25-1044(-)
MSYTELERLDEVIQEALCLRMRQRGPPIKLRRRTCDGEGRQHNSISIARAVIDRSHQVNVVLVVEVFHVLPWYSHKAVVVVQQQLVHLCVDQVLVHVRRECIPKVSNLDHAIGGVPGKGFEGLGNLVRRVLNLYLLCHAIAEFLEVDRAISVRVNLPGDRLELHLLELQADRLQQLLQLVHRDAAGLVPLNEIRVHVVLLACPAKLLEEAEDLAELLLVLRRHALLPLLLLLGGQLLCVPQCLLKLLDAHIPAAILVHLGHESEEFLVGCLDAKLHQSSPELASRDRAVAASVDALEEVYGLHPAPLQLVRNHAQQVVAVRHGLLVGGGGRVHRLGGNK